MGTWTRIVGAKELAEGSGKTVSAGGFELAVFKIDGKFYAMKNQCLHRGGPLGEGQVRGQTVVCPWHGWRYDVPTGSLELIPTLGVAVFKVDVRGEDIFVEIP
jgi:3-phenylpropionate/trans-cinnamate dioxygenase ferredoxin component